MSPAETFCNPTATPCANRGSRGGHAASREPPMGTGTTGLSGVRTMHVLAVCSALLVGCATTGGVSTLGDVRRQSLVFDAGDKTSPTRWRSVTTDDFELMSDLSPADIEEAAQAIAQTLAGLKAMFGNAKVAKPGKVTVIALADDMEFEHVFGRLIDGVALPTEHGTTIFMYGKPYRWFRHPVLTQDAKTSVLLHELAHAVLRSYFPTQPRWFAEGLAQYLETYRWVDAENITIGVVNYEALAAYRGVRSLGVADLKKWGTGVGDEVRDVTNLGLYGASWAFVHWALNQDQQRFGKYMYLLTQTTPDDAWKQTFEPIEADLDVAVHKYLRIGAYYAVNARVPKVALKRTRVDAVTEAGAVEVELLMHQLAEQRAR